MPSTDQFRTLFEMNPQPMWVFDPQTLGIVALNEAAIRTYGYSKEECLSLTVDSIVPFKAATTTTGTNLAGVWPHRAKNGKTFAAEVIQTDLCFEGRNAILVISQDVSTRRRVEAEQEFRCAIAELISKGVGDFTSDALRALFEWLECDNDAIVTVDRNFRIIYWNRAAENLFGRDAQEVLKKAYNCAVSSEEESAAIHAQIVQNGHWKGVITCVDARGKRLIVDISFSGLRDKKGCVQGSVGIHRDVTDRRQTEEPLRITERRLKLPHASGLGVWEMDLKTGKSNWSKELFKIYGIQSDLEGLTLQQWAQRIHPDDREVIMRDALAPSSRSENPDYQYRIVWPDGSIRWLHTKSTVVFDSNMQPSKLIGVDFDITAGKVAERSNREFAAIVEFADLAIFSSDLAGNIVNWNSGAERIFGYSATEIAGAPVRLLAPDDYRRPYEEIGERLGRGQKTEHLETVCITKNAESIQILLSAAPILDQTGAAVGGAYIMWDVTEIKMLQRQLVQAQKLESIGQLAAGIAHEINTPIQYIGDNAKFLEEGFRDLFRLVDSGGHLAEALRSVNKTDLVIAWDDVVGRTDLEYLRGEVPLAIEQLLQGVDHVARIVRAMKEFSHPSSVEMTLVDINRAIESTALVSKNEWKYVADLTTDLDPDLPPVPCVVGEFNQVVLNLIVNAAHAIADVVRGTEQKGLLHIATRRKDQFVEIRLSDTGTGIPENIQSRVFDPFFTTKDVGKGTGQGLALAHSVIVQKHQGSIRFETKHGAGTTFIIQLPLARRDEER